MADDDLLLSNIHALSDVELACLLSLISNEHCIISTPLECLDLLVAELLLISERTFALKAAVVECTPHTTLDDFASSLLHPPLPSPSPTTKRLSSPYPIRPAPDGYFPTSNVSSPSLQPQHGRFSPNPNPAHPLSTMSPRTPQKTPGQSAGQIANIILARDLDKAPRPVQIQALELLRTKRIFTRTSVHTAPKTFMLVAVLGADRGGEGRVTAHLNDFFYLAHWLDPDRDGFAHLEGDDDGDGDDNDNDNDNGNDSDGVAVGPGGADGREDTDRGGARSVDERGTSSVHSSAASVVKRRSRGSGSSGAGARPPFPPAVVSDLRQLAAGVSVDVDVTRYRMNIVSFLRMHRAVAGGVSPQATRHLEQLTKSLAPLHALDYVTPPLVCLAARKVYLHRIAIVADPASERSMQWGSDLAAIETLLRGWAPEDVIEDVLGMVAAPV